MIARPWLDQYKQELSTQLANGTLPHALLIDGVQNSGKRSLAMWLAQVLICQQVRNEQQFYIPCGQCKSCHLFNQHNHADVSLVAYEDKAIGVDEIRRVCQALEKTALLGGARVIIIEAADKMTESAANALLKTLEEPTDGSYLILLSTDSATILPTVISRCRQVMIRPYVGKALAESLGGDSNSAVANISQLPELLDEEVAQAFSDFRQQLSSFLSGAPARLPLSDTLQNSEHGMRWLEKQLTNFHRHKNQWPCSVDPSEQEEAIINTHSLTTLWQCYQLVLKYQQQAKTRQQVNTKFAIDKLLLDIQNTMLQGD